MCLQYIIFMDLNKINFLSGDDKCNSFLYEVATDHLNLFKQKN